jgi:protein ImuB
VAGPAPAIVPADRIPALVTDAAGDEIGVTGRELLTSIPAQVVVPGVSQRQVRGWAGPWPVVERWWDDHTARRAVRLQVVLHENDDETAVLLLREGGRWLVEGIYD